ncbi:MAG: TonB-dependent receptor [Proteobacteria bacterium]|nr:TonB-dependent receptor [Pseudomonadota bacterium]
MTSIAQFRVDRRSGLIVAGAIILNLSVGVPVRAAIGADAPAVASGVLSEIIVTAEKRSETLQKVPLSITALTGETLAQTGADGFSEVAARIPGVVLNSAGPGRSSYSIRGIASVGGNAPTTGFYIDETPILPSGGDGATATVDPDLFDLARVEVLRGPQGTLYGASSMGGTVRLITNQPDAHKTDGAVRLEGSGTEHGGGNVRLDAMYNQPLIDEKVALRVVGTYKSFSGFIDRDIGIWAPNPNADPAFPAYPVSPATPASVVRGVNTERTYSLRAALRIAATDAFTITPSVWVQRLRMGAPSDFDIPTGASGGSLLQARPFDVSERYTDRFELANLALNYEFGWGSLSSNSSYMRRRVLTPDDETEALELAFPQGQFLANAYAPEVTTHEFTEELRLAFNPDGWALSGVVGAYFNNANRHYYVNYLTPNYATLFANTYTTQTLLQGVTLSDVNYWQVGDYSPKQSALFTELNYAFTDRWKITAGVRWYDLQYTTIRHEDGWSNGGPTLSTGAAKNTGFNPKVELSYQATLDQLYYVSASRGVRPGGVNTSNLADKGCGQNYGPYQPDSLWNYELGGKTRWLNGALQVNGAAYYIKWKDVQQGETLPCSYQITQNAGEAIVRGAELEMESQIGSHLQFGLGAGFTKAVLARDAPSLGGVAGQQLENVPRWNGGASAKFSFDPAPAYAGFIRADGQYVGISYPDFDRTDPATLQRAYTLLNLRAGLVHARWELDLFLDNALDKQAYLSKFISDNYDAATRTRMYTNRPRTLGLSLEAKL